jgi:transglutaminase-like putative cysteine protease
MSFDTYFRASSYAMIVVAMLALVLADGLPIPLALAFSSVLVLAWRLEGRKWQLSERVGLVLVLLSIPLFFVDWQIQRLAGTSPDHIGVNALAHLIVFLSAIKLLQVKSDRDWVFLYLISFFEVLLSAGLSFSPIFLGTLILYLFCGISTITAFEIRKARRTVAPVETRLLVAPDAKLFQRLAKTRSVAGREARRLPFVAAVLFILIFVLALPLFLVAPRAGSAMISRAGAGLSNFIGFSENVTLGEIGTLKTNNEVVMRARVEASRSEPVRDLRWRGVALDEFTGTSWRKSPEARRLIPITADRGLFQVGTTPSIHRLTTQTIFLEPLESSVLFALPRTVAIQGDFQFVRQDGEGSIQSRRPAFERMIYKALSDTTEPDADTLRRDRQPYPADFDRYRRVSVTLDPRIGDLARAMIVNRHARTRYDIAKAIESGLQEDYGYTLEMTATGPDPLADFLFNARKGHCEYFSTAMAIMLRTQGMATRVVNGFLPGEFNQAAGAFTVRQSDAHSWVEVYFPETGAWVTFDPTPSAGRTEQQNTGITAQLAKYAEALELFWLQYVIGYDKREQRTLATAVQSQAFHYQRAVSGWFNTLKTTEWRLPLLIAGLLFGVASLTLLAIRVKRFGWRGLRYSQSEGQQRSAIEFYQRLIQLLARQGIQRSPEQTPLEFASSLGSEEAKRITTVYNRVRFGAHRLSRSEQEEIEEILARLEHTTASS